MAQSVSVVQTKLERSENTVWKRTPFRSKKLGKNPRAGQILAGLHAFGLAVGGASTGRDLLSRGLSAALDQTRSTRGAILWVRKGRAIPEVLATEGEPGELAVDRTMTEHVLDTRVCVSTLVQGSGGERPVACVPLRTKLGRAVACLWLERPAGAPAFEESALELATLCGQQLVACQEGVRSHAARLRRHDRRHDRMLDAIPQGIAVVSKSGDLLALNDAARTVINEEAGRAPNGAQTLFGTFSLVDLVTGAFRGKTPPSKDVTLKDGRVFEIGAYPTRSCEQVALVITDVTADRKREAHLLETERTRTLGEGLASVAHELNNPLTAVLGFADLLVERAPQDCLEPAKHIREEATRCVQIARDVLNFARRRPRRDEALDMSQLVSRTQRLLRGELDRAGVELVVGEHAAHALADPRMIQQVVLNLVRNALQALAGRPAPRRIAVHMGSERGRVWCTVEDNGAGIPESVQRRLFEPFFTTKDTGTGLGLSICARIIEDVGGALTVDSAPGRTVFRFDLPLFVGARPAVAKVERGATPARRCKILLADDDPAIRRLLECRLEAAGHSIRLVDDGRAALKAIESGTAFDVVLLDFRMPHFTGLEVVQRLAARKSPLVGRCAIMTGEVDQRSLDAVLASGAALLPKPFELAEIEELIERLSPTGPASPVVSKLSGQDLLAPLVAQFAAKLEDKSTALRLALERSDRQTFDHLAHQLRGSAGTYGFSSISEQVQRLEHAVHSNAPLSERAALLGELQALACNARAA